MTDIWVCSTCHSVNRQRNAKCYKCGAPQSAATGEGSTLRVEQALASRTRVRYRSAWLRGLIAACLIVLVSGLGVVLILLSFDDVAWARDQVDAIVAGGTFDQAAYAERLSDEAPIGLARLGALVVAVLFFAAWLSRVIMNIPALGGGVPRTSPTKAFIYPLIPIVNLIKVPGMIQDALYRVDPRAGGFFMVALAWFGLVGSWIFGFFAGWVIDAKLFGDVAAAETPGELSTAVRGAFDLSFGVDVAQWLMVSIGSLILVGLMIRIERRSKARDQEIREAAGQPRPEAGSVAARPGGAIPGSAAAATVATDPPLVSVPSAAQDPGLRLKVTVEDDGRIIAEMDGETEVITLDQLRDVAAALARAGGSASLASKATDATGHAATRDVAEALRSHGFPVASEEPGTG